MGRGEIGYYLMTMVFDNKRSNHTSRNSIIAVACAGMVVGMVGLAYAAVPLYRIFCQVTGYGGTTQVGVGPSANILDEITTIRFDGNVMKDLNWTFRPAQGPMDIKIGETNIARYTATNLGSEPSTGTSVFNVTPNWAGQYFVKIECFCFTEQRLAPGETVEMPVEFYVDPAIVEDDAFEGLSTITLSYTFFLETDSKLDSKYNTGPVSEFGTGLGPVRLADTKT